MKARVTRKEIFKLLITVLALLVLATGCGSSSNGDDNQGGSTDQTERTDNGDQSDGNVETEAEPLVPSAFELPDNCEDLATFAQDAADAYDAAEFDSQELIDAKARFDAAVGEQVLLDCI